MRKSSAANLLTECAHIDIIVALEFLYENCFYKEIRPIMRGVIGLCYSASEIDQNAFKGVRSCAYNITPKNLISALGFLKSEAMRHKLEDIETLIKSLHKLVFIFYHYQMRKNLSDNASH